MPEFPNKLILPLNLFEDRKTRRLFTPGSSIPVVSPPNNGIELGAWLNWAIEIGIININNVYEVADLTARNNIEEPAQGDVAIIADADGLTSPGLSWYNEGSWTTPFLGGNGIFSAANDGRDVAISSAELSSEFKFTTGVQSLGFFGSSINGKVGADITTPYFSLNASTFVIAGDVSGGVTNTLQYISALASLNIASNNDVAIAGFYHPAKLSVTVNTDRTDHRGGLYLTRRKLNAGLVLSQNDIISNIVFSEDNISTDNNPTLSKSGALIRSKVTQNWSGNLTPANLEFYVSRNVSETGMKQVLTLNDDRSVTFNGYDSTNQIGVGTYALQTDATGKIVKAAISSGS